MTELSNDVDSITALLEDAGCNTVKISGRNLQVSCLFAPYTDGHAHDVDYSPSMGILVEEGEPHLINCFTCGTRFRSLTSMFIALAKHSDDFDDLAQRAAEIESDDLEKQMESLKRSKERKRRERLGTFPQNWYDDYKNMYHPYLQRRGITMETAKKWESGFDKEARRVMFPVRDKSWNLRGAVGRALSALADPRYMDYWEFPRNLNLFGAQLVKPDTELVVVEGIFDAVLTWQALDKSRYSVVATMGSVVSDSQIEIMLSLSSSVILALDSDASGRHSTNKLGEKLKRRCRVKVVDWDAHPQYHDPGEAWESMPEIVDSALHWIEHAVK